jgi:CelD/BcsL family acetyltransferase involved in cellulose biosynthesis
LGAITFRWHETIPAVLRLGKQWDELLSSWDVDNAFLRWDWIRTWLRVYGHSADLLIGLAVEGDQPVGLAPLALVREKATPLGPVVRSIRILGDGPLCPDHLVLPVRPGSEREFGRALLEALEERRSSWDRIELRDLLGEHPAWKEAERAAKERGQHVIVRQRTHCPYIALPSAWDEYLESLGTKLKKSIRYGLRRLDREFSVEIVEPASIAEVDRMMEQLEWLHGRAWQTRGATGVFADQRFRLFHRLHARRSHRAKRGWLVGMRAQDRDLAVFLGFRTRRGGLYYQLGHDPELGSYSIGTMMVASCIRQAITQGFAEMDFLRGAGAYKYRLAKEERRGHDLIIHSGNIADRATSLAWAFRLWVGGILRSALGQKRARWLKTRIGVD